MASGIEEKQPAAAAASRSRFGDTKSTWRVAQRLLHTDRQAVHDDADCATLVATFSQYFVEISQIRANIASTLQSMTVRHFEVRRHVGSKLSTFLEVTLDEVRRLLSKMPSKSSPHDVLPCSLIKSCQDVFAPVIAKLANLSLRSGKFPTCYRCVHRYCRF